MDDGAEEVQAAAYAALHELANQQAIDALCALWVERRDARLRVVLQEKGYIGAQPRKVRVLCASLLVGRAVADVAVPLLVEVVTMVQEVRAAWCCITRACQSTGHRCLVRNLGGTRDARLRVVLREKSYIGAEPLRVRVLSSLLVGRAVADAEAVPLLVEALNDADEQVRAAAEATAGIWNCQMHSMPSAELQFSDRRGQQQGLASVGTHACRITA